LGSIADPDAQFTSVSPQSSTTYTVTATDEYGCMATDEVHVDVLPLPEVNISDPGAIYWLDSATLAGYTSTGDYTWTSTGELSCTACEDPLVTPDEPIWVYLETTDANGCTGRDSLLIELVYPIYVPNAFTPDNDGINDVFFASGEGITGFDMKIIDRWGNLVFHSTDIKQVWNGSYQGGTHYVQNDVYVWIIEYDAKAGRARLEGHVTLVR
jgi:gliding motility-associated-like protein